MATPAGIPAVTVSATRASALTVRFFICRLLWRLGSSDSLDHRPCMFRGREADVAFVLRTGGLPEPVADAPDGLDARGGQPGRGELGAQPGHVDVHGTRLLATVPHPHGAAPLFTPDDRAPLAWPAPCTL